MIELPIKMAQQRKNALKQQVGVFSLKCPTSIRPPSAVKLYRIFAAEHGVVNPVISYYETACDESYRAPGSGFRLTTDHRQLTTALVGEQIAIFPRFRVWSLCYLWP